MNLICYKLFRQRQDKNKNQRGVTVYSSLKRCFSGNLKESKVAVISDGIPIKKVAFHDDLFLENNDFDKAPLYPHLMKAKIQMFMSSRSNYRDGA